MNTKITVADLGKREIDSIAEATIYFVQRYLSDPKHREACEKWKKEREA